MGDANSGDDNAAVSADWTSDEEDNINNTCNKNTNTNVQIITTTATTIITSLRPVSKT